MRGDRGSILRRLAAISRYMTGRRYAPDLRCLARGLGVSERTIRRDLEAMEAEGYDLPKWRDAREAV